MIDNNKKNLKETQDEMKRNDLDSLEQDSEKESDEKTVQKKFEELENKFNLTEEKLLRSLAETENQRRRFEKEVKDAFEFGSFNFAKESLAILDNLQRAKEAIKNDEKLKTNEDLEKFLENITIIEKDLISIFEKNRIKKINTKNKKFDPNFHQAMSETEDKKTESGTILQEIQAGYMLGDRLLRPSLVGVSKNNLSKNHENDDNKEEK